MFQNSFFRKISKLSAVAAVIIVAGMMAGCQQEDFWGDIPEMSVLELKSQSIEPGKFQFYDKQYDIPYGKRIWEASLDKFIETNLFKKGSKIELIGYKYIRDVKDINDLENIKSNLFDKNALFPEKVKMNVFELKSAEETTLGKEWYKDILFNKLPTSKKYLTKVKELSIKDYYTFKKGDLKMIELEWKYLGEILHTVCLVSDEEDVIYDNLMSHLSITFSYSSVTKTNRVTKITRLKSGNENPNDCEPNQTLGWDKIEGKAEYLKNGVIWRSYATMTVSGECVCDNNGVYKKSITSYRFSPDTYSSNPTDYPFDAKIIYFGSPSTGVNGEVTFSWAWFGGLNFGAKILISGDELYVDRNPDNVHNFASYGLHTVTPNMLYPK